MSQVGLELTVLAEDDLELLFFLSLLIESYVYRLGLLHTVCGTGDISQGFVFAGQALSIT